MRSFYKYCVYVSLLFLVTALYRADYLRIPHVFCPGRLALSMVLLFLGFIGSTVAWHRLLARFGIAVPVRYCVAGMGLSVFGKYVPGKVWLVLGRAAYIAQRTGHSTTDLGLVSLATQLVTIWVGLLLGLVGFCFAGGFYAWGGVTLALWLALSAAIFGVFVHDVAARTASRVLRRKVKLPRVSLRLTLALMPWFLAYWLLWAVGFCLFVQALTDAPVGWHVAFGFPLAASLGIVSLITPGGLGTREGVLVACLVGAGIAGPAATSIATASRLWFLMGEFFVFAAGWVAHVSVQRAENSQGGAPHSRNGTEGEG